MRQKQKKVMDVSFNLFSTVNETLPSLSVIFQHEFHSNLVINFQVNQFYQLLIHHQWIPLLHNIERLCDGSVSIFGVVDQQEILLCLKQISQVRRCLRRWIQRRREQKCVTINSFDLNLTELDFQKPLFVCLDLANKAKYFFTKSELYQLFRFSLQFIDFEYSDPQPPKNPYTNQPFTLKQNVDAYLFLLADSCSRGKILPNYLIYFKNSYFDVKRFHQQYMPNLMYMAKCKELEAKTYEAWWREMETFIANQESNIQQSYCKLCIKKTLGYTWSRQLLTPVLALQFMNDNGYDHLGNAGDDYESLAQKYQIWFERNHRRIHKPRLRAARQTINQRLAMPSISLELFPQPLLPASESVILTEMTISFPLTLDDSENPNQDSS